MVETSNYYIPKIFVSKKNNKINKINEIKKRKYILDKKISENRNDRPKITFSYYSQQTHLFILILPFRDKIIPYYFQY